jgi:hypothetical protein
MKFVNIIKNKPMETLVFGIVLIVLMVIALLLGRGNRKSDGIHQFSYYSINKNRFTIHTDYDEKKIKGWIPGGGISCHITAKCDESELSEVRVKERERIKEIVRKMELAEKIK